jgi:hypothetical protein
MLTNLPYTAIFYGGTMPQRFQFDGIIRNVSYSAQLTRELPKYDFLEFDVNTAKPFGFIDISDQKIAYSKWDSPNQDKAYPFARIYNTYNAQARIVVIPIMKDDGTEKKLECAQYSILSWMNLAGVYIILTFYDGIRQSRVDKRKIIAQILNTEVVNLQLIKLMSYKSDHLHWNRNLFENHFKEIYNKAVNAYETMRLNHKIETCSTDIKLNKFIKVAADLQKHEGISVEGRTKIRQDRELHANKVEGAKKNVFYLIDTLGGIYYLSSKEVLTEQGSLIIQEKRNAGQDFLPPMHQIQDALFRLSLMQNIDTLYFNGREIRFQSRLKLCSKKALGILPLPCVDKTYNSFIRKNKKNLLDSDLNILLKMREEVTRNPRLIIEIEGTH